MKKKNGYAKGIKIIVYILDVFFLCLIGYKAYNALIKDKINNHNQNNINEQNKIVFDEETVNKLISTIPYSSITMGIYKDAYNGKLTTINDIQSMALASTIMGNYNDSYTAKSGNSEAIKELLIKNNLDKESTYIVYTQDYIDNQLYQKYNTRINNLNNLTNDIKIVYLNDELVTILSKINDITKYNKVASNYKFYEYNDDIFIIEKTIFTVLNNDVYYIYPNSNVNEKQSFIKTFEKENNILTVIKEWLNDYQPVFKHTLKKGEAGYYWYSTEYLESE